MLNVNTNYNINHNVNFKAADPKPPVYKRMLTGYEKFESNSKNTVREYLLDLFSDWDCIGGGIAGAGLILGLAIGFFVCIYHFAFKEQQRMEVKDTQEYVKQYDKANKLYEEGALMNSEYEARLGKLLPEYDKIINETEEKLDNVVQLRLLRSEVDLPKDPETGKYSYEIKIEGNKAYVDVKEN